MATNRAAWLDGAAKKLRIDEADMPKPESDEVVIKNSAIAINPVDWKIQDSGYFIKTWPMILGCDAAGTVTAVGSSVTRFQRGDRVTGHTISLLSQSPQDGGFQLYSRLKANKTAILPESVSFAAGSVLPLALDTAAVGLYSPAEGAKGLGLPPPSLEPKPSGKVLVCWGGSSSVGALVIQLAVASGAKVVATASPHNFEFCKDAGASEVLDYRSGSVVEDVVAAVKKVGGEFMGLYDAISLPEESYKHTVPIVEKLGGGPLAFVLGPPENAPESVKPAHVFGVNDMTSGIWEDYVTAALEKGKLRCLPPPQVVGKGLESVQAGLDANKKGVSAKKVVIEFE
ncbi:hypothetical protein LTR91_003550 [Friedmanniomyces endolithicus]|uniref:Enoyl reductase (ER) domain-containing protein n=1 Tax=Friedmanniomyces endolithicus TaxID=329885 RepID=A0AAN6KYW7_9PEZI|nr:hypothetical protein LTR35_013604 [Friedmanniomyces endolithicus]KAK0277379.1 hypothetical protein LTS00_014213 [Friedmanniomyces endolithicus]KAK0325623.1 hypothetical protein LTR82_003159 [Friedmanniomyces endolithicus]KAK0926754.1 hypothetical protein LTR57_003796 [Friedmanniomyces endolithicus]KAK0978369.1 hypothetical protein LTR54_015966 [Friedmanniomyces endolithicus]